MQTNSFCRNRNSRRYLLGKHGRGRMWAYDDVWKIKKKFKFNVNNLKA